MTLYLGLDASSYTSSVALVDGAGELVADRRLPILVRAGDRGLRQSEVLFRHIGQLPEVLAGALTEAGGPVMAVAASVRPRPDPASYLPCFRASRGLGMAVAAALRVPFVPVSHQEGHILAALRGRRPPAERFLALHLSGGTTELVACAPEDRGLAVQSLGTGLDIHAGQFVDRVGVAMGLPFPAGPDLEALARQGTAGAVCLPVAVHGVRPSFAGPESAAMRALQAGAAPADVALAVLHCLARACEQSLRAAMDATGLRDIVLSGGVAANALLRERLEGRLGHARLHWPGSALATDSAAGPAWLARAALMGW
ncbi:MAG: O-sialoglycoprotein endopeptidase [Bacillota bacterium]